MAVMASCAFLSLAADTIFIAEVICMVEETEAMRLRISLRFAIADYSNCADTFTATSFRVSNTVSVSLPDLIVSSTLRWDLLSVSI